MCIAVTSTPDLVKTTNPSFDIYLIKVIQDWS